MSTPSPDPLEVARGLTQSLDGVKAELAQVNRYGRRSRHIIVATIVSLVLDIALTVIVTFALVAEHHNAATISQLHGSEISGCVAGNQTRVAEISIWDKLYAGSVATMHLTPKQKADDEAFLAYIAKVFAPRDCEALYKLK